MNDKLIRGSRRGLTFSFPSKGCLSIGQRFEYIIDKARSNIKIIPSVVGSHTVSRKRSGGVWNALIDLRSKEVIEAIAGIKQLRVSLTDTQIIITDAAFEQVCTEASCSGAILQFPRSELADLRKVSGLDDCTAVNKLLTGAQITLDEYLVSRGQPISVQTIQRDLSDVYTLVSLFSGAGILDWPFLQDGRFMLQYAIDSDAAACETYRHNIGMHIVHGDIHRAFTMDGYPLDDAVSTPDAMIGGPPCKPFSNANRHTRLADHPDSDLLMQYMRIVKALRPKVFAIENVPEVLTACSGAYFNAIQEVAADCGYSVSAKIVQDNKVGGYTTRERAVILGSRVGIARFSEISLEKGGKTAGDALSQVNIGWSNYDDITLPGSRTRERMSFVPPGGNYKDIPAEFQTPGKNRHSSTYRRLAWDEPSPTIVNWRKPPLIHPKEDRTLTVAEAKALQGLPGNYRIFGTLGQKQQQVGNAVPVALGKYIKNAVLALLQSSRPCKSTSLRCHA